MSDPNQACGTCRANRGGLPAPGGVIYQDAQWRLEHVMPPLPMAGWLVLKPLRHIESVADLDEAEAAELGPLLQAVSAALTKVTGASKIYVAQFGEAPGFAHIHFHVIARPTDLASDEMGPRIFTARKGKAATEGARSGVYEEAERISDQVRDLLSSMLPPFSARVST